MRTILIPIDMSIQTVIRRLDQFQQKHPVIAFPYAVIKKFGDDTGGYQAALITYYGFLSLFPLILVALMVLQLLFENNASLRADVIANVGDFFPVLGNELENNIHSNNKSGWALVAAILITLYGTRGGADALRFALDNMWQIPRHKRAGFPKNILRSFGVIGCAAAGFGAAVAVSSATSVLGHALWVKILLNIAGVVVISAVLVAVFRIATSRKIAIKDMVVGTVFGAVIIQLLLTFGGLLLKHYLKGMDSLYGTFAIVLGLLFWIYLLAQVLVYSIEIDTVRTLKLWPRSITPECHTDADRKAYDLYAKSARHIPEEKVFVAFEKQDKQKCN